MICHLEVESYRSIRGRKGAARIKGCFCCLRFVEHASALNVEAREILRSAPPSLIIGRAIIMCASFGQANCDDREPEAWVSSTSHDERQEMAEGISNLFAAVPDSAGSPGAEERAYFARYRMWNSKAFRGDLDFDDDQILIAATVTAAEL